MKKTIVGFVMMLLAAAGYAQENMFTISGGYAFADVVDSELEAEGWRLGGLYEFNPMGGKFAHGVYLGYIGLAAEGEVDFLNTRYEIGTWPLYYAPKFLIGNESLKGFVRGAFGFQFSTLKRTALVLTREDTDFGLMAGVGVGGSYFFTEKVFVSAEYEFSYLSNGFYRDGLLSTLSAGIGIKF